MKEGGSGDAATAVQQQLPAGCALVRTSCPAPHCLLQVSIMEDEEQNIHLKNLSVHRAATEEEALNLVSNVSKRAPTDTLAATVTPSASDTVWHRLPDQIGRGLVQHVQVQSTSATATSRSACSMWQMALTMHAGL